MKTTRRSFLGALTAGAVCSSFAWEPPAQQLPIAFSTLGCPAWDFAKILDFAAANGFAAIELRGLQGNLDLPSHPAFTPDHLEQTKRAISAHKLRIACVSSSSEMGESDPEKRAKGFADGRRFIELAQTLQREAPSGSVLHVEPGGGVAWQALGNNPFAIFGGLAG